MSTLLVLLLLSAACVAASGEENIVKGLRNNSKPENEDLLDKLTEDFPSHITASTLGSLGVVVLLGFLIYYCCCHKKTPEEGFTQLENENTPRRNNRWRWRNRGFPRRNRRRNYQPNPADAPPTTHVVIQPVVAVGIPTDNLHTSGATAVPNMMPPAPPPYDGGMNNQRYFHGDNIRHTMTNPPPQFRKY